MKWARAIAYCLSVGAEGWQPRLPPAALQGQGALGDHLRPDGDLVGPDGDAHLLNEFGGQLSAVQVVLAVMSLLTVTVGLAGK